MKRFPKIRLTGNQDVAATYIRRGKIENERTKKLRQRLGVPTYARTIVVDEYTRVHTLLEKGQEIIVIECRVPEEKVEEVLKKQEKEELEECQPAFVVYMNKRGDETYPVSTGHKITYVKGTWKLDPVSDAEKYCGTASWFHVRDNYRKYYNKADLKRCQLISWQDNRTGVFDSKSGYSSSTHYPSPYRNSYIYVSGRQFYVGTWPDIEVIGACYLPDRSAKEDFFYVLTTETGASTTDNPLRVYKFNRDTTKDYLAPKTSTKTLVATIEGDDLRATLAGARDWNGYLHPAHSAYIDKDGTAHLMLQCLFDTIYPGEDAEYWVQHSIFANAAFNVYGPGQYDSTTFSPVYVQIDMKTGEFETEIVALSDVMGHSLSYASMYQSWEVQGAYAYDGSLVSSAIGKDNDILINLTGSAEYKSPGQMRVRTDALMRGKYSCNVFNGKQRFAIYGGCDALYVYSLQLEQPPFNASMAGDGGGRLVNYTGTPPPSSFPVHSWTYAESIDPINYSYKLILEKDDDTVWEFTVLEASRSSYGYSREKKIVKSLDSVSSSTAEGQTLDIDHADREDPGFLACTYSTDSGGNYCNFHVINRKLIFHHPQILDLYTYLEFELSGAQPGTECTSRLSYWVVHNRRKEERWSRTSTDTMPGGPMGRFIVEFPYDEDSHFTGPFCTRDSDSSGTHVASKTYDLDYRGAITETQNLGYGPFALNALGIKSMQGWGFGITATQFGSLAPDPNFAERYDFGGLNPIRSYRSSDTVQYARTWCAVHQSNFGPNRKKSPYIVYLRHPEPTDEDIEIDSWYAIGNQWLPGDSVPANACYYPAFDEADPDGEFFSNVLTLEQIKKLTDEESDFPVDFGVI